MTLAELSPGKKGRILRVGGEGVLRLRLLDMGLTPRTQVAVSRTAPGGDPMELRVRGYELAVRLDDAQYIEIEEIR